MESLLQIDQLHVYYNKIAALKGISLYLQQGEIVAMIGANGAGKTTLINTISGILPSQKGFIRFKDEIISNLPACKIARKGIVQIPEGRKIFPGLTVVENMELGAFSKNNKKKVRENMGNMYNLFPVLSERKKQLAGTLSGGEQQMLAIARGLMAEPEILMFDEPSMGLSPILVEKVFQTIGEINKIQGITILLVEQNAKKSLQIAERAYVLETGNIVISDTADNLMGNDMVKKAYLGEQ